MSRRGARFLLVLLGLAGAPASALAQSPATVPGDLIVRWRPDADLAARRTVRASVRAGRVRDLALIHAEQLRLPPGVDPEVALALLRADPRVEYAEPDFVVHADAIPDDSLFAQQWSLRNTGQTGGTPGADIHAVAAWDRSTGDPGLRIGLLDTGVDFTHPDLAANVWTNPGEIPDNGVDDDGNGYVDDVHGYDFVHDDPDPRDDNGHGTHCAGILAGAGNNGAGVCGVAWRAAVVPIKILDDHGAGTIAGAVAGLQYAVTVGVRLTSNSWGGPYFSRALQEAIEAAGARQGALFVAAAGNAARNVDVVPDYPSGYDSPWIVSVASSGVRDSLAPTSNWGVSRVDLAAPGEDILSLAPGGGYRLLSGTSMATPHVAGALALVIGRFPDADPLTLRQRLLDGVDPVPALAGRVASGGRLNAARPLADADAVPPGAIADLRVTGAGSTHVDLAFTATGDDGAAGTAWRYDVRVAPAPIGDEAAFAAATPVAVTAPRPAGAPDSIEIGGLEYATRYWIALRARDEFGNAGPISDPVEATTLGAPHLGDLEAPAPVTVPVGGSATRTLVVRNTGEGTLDFTVPVPTFDDSVPGVPPVLRAAWGPSTGGPDAFGYEWIDNNAGPAGPAFAWQDITWDHDPLPLTGDDALSAPVPIGFTFPFYGGLYEEIRVCTNGWLTFAEADPMGANQALPSPAAPVSLIAPLWDDYDLGDAQRIWAASVGDRFIVTWSGVTKLRGGPHTFQAILTPDGAIRFQYLTVGRDFRSCTVGIQDGAGASGLLLSYNDEYPMSGLAVLIYARRRWLEATPAAGRVAAGGSASVALRFDAAGLAPGARNGTVSVVTNDRESPRVTLPVAFTVLDAPDLEVIPAAIRLDSLDRGGATAAAIRLYNPGTRTLEVTDVASGDPDVGVDVPTATLDPGHSIERRVTFRGGAPGVHRGVLRFASNDPDQPELAVPYEGVVRGDPVPAAPALRLAGASPAAEARIELALPSSGRARALVYDARGARVRTVIDADLPAGVHRVSWDGRDARGHRLPQGLYFIRLSGAGTSRIVRFVLLR